MNYKGFTLMELLVVIGILGILAMVLFLTLNPEPQFRKARDSARKANLREIKTSLESYRNTCEAYPANGSGADLGKIVGCGASLTCATAIACQWGEPWKLGEMTFMKVLPKDPLQNQNYNYTKIDNDSFRLVAFLERKDDPQGRDSQTRCGWDDGDSNTNEYVVCED